METSGKRVSAQLQISTFLPDALLPQTVRAYVRWTFMDFLFYSWRYLCLATNDRGRIPLRNIVKTFSSGKPERMVHKCLSDLGLAGDKVRFLFFQCVIFSIFCNELLHFADNVNIFLCLVFCNLILKSTICKGEWKWLMIEICTSVLATNHKL